MAKRKKAKKKTTKSAKEFSVGSDQVGETVTYSYTTRNSLTPREKKAIIEKEVFCRECNADGKRVLAAKVDADGAPLCRVHGKNL